MDRRGVFPTDFATKFERLWDSRLIYIRPFFIPQCFYELRGHCKFPKLISIFKQLREFFFFPLSQRRSNLISGHTSLCLWSMQCSHCMQTFPNPSRICWQLRIYLRSLEKLLDTEQGLNEWMCVTWLPELLMESNLYHHLNHPVQFIEMFKVAHLLQPGQRFLCRLLVSQ